MHSSDRMNHNTIAGRIFNRAFLIAAACVAAVSVAHAQVPAVNFSYPTQIAKSSSAGTNQDNGAAINKISVNQRGDLFWVNSNNIAGGYNTLVELPVGSTTQVLLVKNLSSPVNGATVDSYGNVWSLNGKSAIIFIPYVNATYASGIDISVTTLPNCKVQGTAGINMATVNPTPCLYPGINPANFAYYTALSDFVIDAAGDIIGADYGDGNTPINTKCRIVKYDAATGVESLLVDNLPPASNKGRIAVAANGDMFFVDQTALYYVASGATTFTTLTGYGTPTGVSSDFGGNIYVDDGAHTRLVVLPAINGVVSQSSAYSIGVSTAVNVSFGSVGVDRYGTAYFAGSGYGGSVWSMPVGYQKAGSIAVGSTTGTSYLNLTFTAAATFGSFKLTGSAGTSPFALAGTNTCTANTAYAIGATCTVGFNFKAPSAGPQSGTLSAYSSTGTLLGTARISGFGIGGILNVDPGAVTAIGTTWKTPNAVTVDSAGNTYVADSTTGSIYKNGNTTAIATGFSAPSSIVVDGAGNLYVGDSGNSRIAQVPYSGTAYGTPTTIYSGLSGPSGLAIDSNGNLYVADSGKARVLLLAAAGNLALGTETTLVGSGYTKPVAVAVDNLGNVYVSDSGSEKIIQVGLTTGITTTIASSLKTAAGVAVDPGGNLYYIDSGAATITRIPNIAGVVTGTGTTVPTVVAAPAGLAFDASGNLFVVDSMNAAVAELARTAGLLNFGNVVQGTMSKPQTATLSDGGTAAVALSTPYYVQTGTLDFGLQPSSTCQNGGMIATGASCSVVEVFSPTTLNPENASLAFASNGGNPTLALNGVGTVLITATITGPTSVAYGTPGSFTAKITPAVGSTYIVDYTSSLGVTTKQTITMTNGTSTFSNPPTLAVGTYSLALEGTVGSASFTVTQATLVATVSDAMRVYGAPNPPFTCTFAAGGVKNGDAIACVGNAVGVTATSAPGKYIISATAVGAASASYVVAQPPVSTFGTLTITQGSANVALAFSPPGPYLVGASVTFTATVSPLTAGVPTGTVTFVNVTYPSSPIVLSPAQPLSGGIATFSTTALASGTSYIEAMYSGDTNFPPTNSIPTAITISPPSFVMALSPTSLVISQGHLGSTTLTITPVGNYTTPIVLSCIGLPVEATCTFGYPTVTLNGNPFPTTVVITTTKTSAKLTHPFPWGGIGGGAVMALLAGFFTGFRRKRFKTGLCTFLLVALLGTLPITGCGAPYEPNYVTPLGTYPSVQINGSSNTTGLVVSVTLRLTVIP